MQKLSASADYLAAFIAGAILVCIVALVSVCCDSFTAPEQKDRVSLTPVQEDAVSYFDISDPVTGETYTGAIYTGQNPVGCDYVTGAFQNSDVAMTASDLYSEGYLLSLERSKYIKTSKLIDNEREDVYITLIVFEQEVTDQGYSLAVIKHIVLSKMVSVQLEKVVCGYDPWNYWTPEENSIVTDIGEDEYAREVWVKSFEPNIKSWNNDYMLAPMDPPTPLDPTQIDWQSWLICVSSETAVGCAVASVTCAFTSGPYSDCVDAHCQEAAIAATVRCSVRQILDHFGVT